MTFSNNYLPASQVITNITRATNAVVTTASPHGYDDQLIVRIVLPPGINFGMNQINGATSQITVIDNQNFSINVNTSGYDAFVSSSIQDAQVIPIAEVGYTFTMAEINAGNIVPESNPVINP